MDPMGLQTFTAPTMAEALTQVKRVLGHDAVILHTRSMQRREWFGLRKREVVEVTAGPGTGEHRRRRPNESKPAQDTPKKPPSALVGNHGAAAYARNSTVAGLKSPAAAPYASSNKTAPPTPAAFPTPRAFPTPAGFSAPGAFSAPPRTFATSPEMTGVMVKLVTEEMSGLKSELRELVNHVRKNSNIGWGNGAAQGAPAPVPEELYSHYRQLIENQVAAELAEDIIKSVRLQVPAGYLKNESFVREKVAEQLERLLPAGGPIRRTKSVGPHVVALIGPTGVGKTTTLAKLAAELQLREGKKVGMITMDTYRIAAVDQLRRYSDIIGSPLSVVNSPEEMKTAIVALAEMDYILIDTAGRSPTDSMKLSELKRFLEAAAPDEVHLVLSATSDPRSVDLAVAAFSKVRVDRILFTKVDEAATVGLVLNVARQVGKSISYLTTGQDVPYDIEVFRGGRLAKMILGRSDVGGVLGNDDACVSGSVAQKSAQVSRNPSEARIEAAGGVK